MRSGCDGHKNAKLQLISCSQTAEKSLLHMLNTCHEFVQACRRLPESSLVDLQQIGAIARVSGCSSTSTILTCVSRNLTKNNPFSKKTTESLRRKPQSLHDFRNHCQLLPQAYLRFGLEQDQTPSCHTARARQMISATLTFRGRTPILSVYAVRMCVPVRVMSYICAGLKPPSS